MTSSFNPPSENIIIDDMETPPLPPNLDNATLFKTLKNLLDDGIKPAMGAQFTGLQNMFTQTIEDTRNRKITTVCKITEEEINRTIYQIREDNSRLQSQVAGLTREVQSMVAAKTTHTWISPTMTNPLPIISDSYVALAAVNKRISKQHVEEKTILLPPQVS